MEQRENIILPAGEIERTTLTDRTVRVCGMLALMPDEERDQVITRAMRLDPLEVPEHGWMVEDISCAVQALNAEDAHNGGAEDHSREQMWALIMSTVHSLEVAEEFEQAAFTDYLTGAYNRRGRMAQLASRYGLPETGDRVEESVNLTDFYFDAANFKWINDVLGHHVGDAAILASYWRVRQMFRGSDAPIISRLGGDEWSVLLANLKGSEIDMLRARITREEIEKVRDTSSAYPTAKEKVDSRLHQLREAGIHKPRIEVARIEPPEGQEGGAPYHILIIEREKLEEVRLEDLLVLALGRASATVHSVQEVEKLDQDADKRMDTAKEIIHILMDGKYREQDNSEAEQPVQVPRQRRPSTPDKK